MVVGIDTTSDLVRACVVLCHSNFQGSDPQALPNSIPAAMRDVASTTSMLQACDEKLNNDLLSTATTLTYVLRSLNRQYFFLHFYAHSNTFH